MIKHIADLPRSVKSLVMLSADALLLAFSLWTAIGVRTGMWQFPQLHAAWVYTLPSLIAIPVFIRMGLYRAVVRYLEMRALVVVTVAVSVSVCLFAGLLVLLTLPPVPRGALLIYWLLAIVYIASSRFLARALLRQISPSRLHRPQRAVAIYGAGTAGRQLALALRAGHDYVPMLFVDDSKALQGMEIAGMRTYAPQDLPRQIRKFGISQVLLAIPSASRARRLQIIDELELLEVEVRVIPGMSDLVDGAIRAEDIREVEIDDLLGREIVPPNGDLIDANIRGKHVMVTGAGGSIGSELCRQIIQCGPKTLLLYEQSEFALYSIEQELSSLIASKRLDISLVPVLGSVQNESRLRDVMTCCAIQTVYHAAAYKHVPIVEFNITEGVLNNTFGTHATARAAIATGVEIMVLVSTDKAVRPTNIMGASKRFAELILQSYADAGKALGSTRLCIVRFGNVLGSSGSVVPLFRKQIASGGPVTVTHADITRYFMTIPEAAQLVIQAGAMSVGGEVFVLDMGEPVKIVDLARRMIHLSGFSVRDEADRDGDIEIRVTGLRPGEKLYEELLIGDNVAGTRHPKIMMANEHFYARDALEPAIQRLYEACLANDHDAVVAILREHVSGFNMISDIQDHLYSGSSTGMPAKRSQMAQ